MRVRFTSPYPVDFNDRVIEAMAELDAVCPSLHLPVQSGSDPQLAAMRRGYNIGEYRELVKKMRRAIPDIALTTDIIAGFCGETEEDFQLTCELMEEIRYDSAFMFKYSPREGTYAHKSMPDDVPEALKGERLQKIIKIQERISDEVNTRAVGQRTQVLVEGISKRRAKDGRNRYYGRSPQGKTVVFPQQATANSLVAIDIDRNTSHTLFGNLVSI